MTAVPKRSNSLVQTLKGMVNVFPKNRLPKFAFNDDLEKEVMEGVLRERRKRGKNYMLSKCCARSGTFAANVQMELQASFNQRRGCCLLYIFPKPQSTLLMSSILVLN